MTDPSQPGPWPPKDSAGPADDTRPMEVRRWGPTPSHFAAPSGWPPPVSSAPQPPTPPARRGMGAGAIIGAAVVAGIVSGSLSAAAVSNLLRDESPPVASSQSPTGSNVASVRIDESSAIIAAVEQAMPAVVTVQSRQDSGPFGGSSGSGSGFIFDASGWILTNRHVVDGATAVQVVLDDTRVLPAQIYGIDTLTDLAILKVESDEPLPTIALGSSAELEPGQLAIAIGNPLGTFENTVTTGVVSGLGRQIRAGDATQQSSEQLNNLIQTDAAINPGNSGGPLINSAGQVIGINTAVSQEAQGIGFAIPIDVARPILEQALAGEQLERPWIGVYYQPVTRALAEDEDLSVDHGVLIGNAGTAPAVFPGSPAAEAGLRPGDVIVAVDGERVDADRDLSFHILPHRPGDQIVLSVVRDGSEREVTVELGTLPETN